jgi:hypothetical protein
MKIKKTIKRPARKKDTDTALVQELRAELDRAAFDGEGFRIHSAELLAHGQIFFPFLPEKGMGKQELARILRQEYARECQWAYDYQRDFLLFLEASKNRDSQTFSAKWPSFMVEIVESVFPLHPLYGLEASIIHKVLEPDPAAKVYPLKDASHIFSEPGQPALEVFAHGLIQDYWLAVDWSKGPEAVERSLRAWIRCNAPAGVPTLRGRNNAVDRFRELAAYRAKRAGMDHISFGDLVGRTGSNAIYSDQPQFLRAARSTAKRIKKFDADVQRFLVTHRKKNK